MHSFDIELSSDIVSLWGRKCIGIRLLDFQLDGELYLAPGFPTPPNCDYKGYQSYIDAFLPQESPHLYGLHPNAEIDFLTTTSENLFRTVLEMQPRDSGTGSGLGVSREDKVCTSARDEDSVLSGRCHPVR